MTPFEISIALHYYARVGDCEEISVPIGPSTIREFCENGLLKDGTTVDDNGQRFHPTDRLKAYVEALQAVQLPIQKWVQPE